jgi:hypothetical protein
VLPGDLPGAFENCGNVHAFLLSKERLTYGDTLPQIEGISRGFVSHLADK